MEISFVQGCAFEAGKQFAQNYSREIEDGPSGSSNTQQLKSAVDETFQVNHLNEAAVGTPPTAWKKLLNLLQPVTSTNALKLSGFVSWERLLPFLP